MPDRRVKALVVAVATVATLFAAGRSKVSGSARGTPRAAGDMAALLT